LNNTNCLTGKYHYCYVCFSVIHQYTDKGLDNFMCPVCDKQVGLSIVFDYSWIINKNRNKTGKWKYEDR